MYVLALLTVICVVLTWILPESVNEPKGSLYTAVEERSKKRGKVDGSVEAPLLENEVN